MSQTYIIGDLHFGHANITEKFRTQFTSMEEHENYIIQQWNSVIKKGGDRVFVLGDAAFSWPGLHKFKLLQGKKFLVRGNHDELPTQAYLCYFEEVYGLVKYKNAWLSHAPMHPDELRGLYNVHGHVHDATIFGHFPCGDFPFSKHAPDRRYINTCPEIIGYAPRLFRDLVPVDG